jgi:hypothetical protein
MSKLTWKAIWTRKNHTTLACLDLMHAKHGVDECEVNDPCKLTFYIDHINIYLSHYFYISQFAHFIGKFSRKHVQILYHVFPWKVPNKMGRPQNKPIQHICMFIQSIYNYNLHEPPIPCLSTLCPGFIINPKTPCYKLWNHGYGKK